MTARSTAPSPATPSPSTSVTRWDARTWGLLIVLCGAFFLDTLDVTMIGVALPSIGGDLDLSTSDLGLSLLTTTFPQGRARNRALSIYASFAAVGFSGGLVFGGLLTEVGWRWTFFVPGPLAALLVVTGLRLIPRDKPAPAGQRQSFDLLGAISVRAALLV